jgi:hypothetical protein
MDFADPAVITIAFAAYIRIFIRGDHRDADSIDNSSISHSLKSNKSARASQRYPPLGGIGFVGGQTRN